MSLIRDLGKGLGKAAGFVVGKPIEFVGEVTGVNLIEDIGKGVQTASEFAGDTVGQVASGAVDTVSGIINEDSTKRDKGLGEMGNAVSRTAKGVVVTAKNAIHDGGDVIGGFMDGDQNRMKKGASSLVKTVAVSSLAIGLLDVVDGADGDHVAQAETPDTPNNTVLSVDSDSTLTNEGGTTLETTNDHLAGSVHPETGVPFEENTVELPTGEVVTGVYPVFDVEYEVQMDESLYLQSDYVHFNYANAELYDAIQADSQLADDLGLSEQDIQALANGDTPEGFTWHHNEEPGVLQLVDEEIHANTGHDGGRELWGGGEQYR
ncbi:HNH endonuclease [Bacillus timonensis]|uniref:HNH endonuclease n=1 Tax=Bacillus timonensis TaxID=1033734 RepID=UPI000288D76D|nr:HNH endonuclease [Bacillus timonensis]